MYIYKYFSFIFILLNSLTCLAGPADKFLSYCTMKLERHFLKTVEANENEILQLTATAIDQDKILPLSFNLSVGKRLGAGYLAQAVIVQNISDPVIEFHMRNALGSNSIYKGTLVAKIPHAIKEINFGYPIPASHSANKKELAAYLEHQTAISDIEKNSNFPENPAWKKGILPVAPILGSLRTQRGLILMKALVRGKNLSDLAKRYNDNGNQLPTDIEESLKNYYQFVQAVYATTGFSTDIRPTNFTWIENDSPDSKEQLEFLGFQKPGLMAFEMGRVPFNKPQYISSKGGLSFEKYKTEFIEYLERELHNP